MSVKAQTSMDLESLSPVPEANLSQRDNRENGGSEEDYNLNLSIEDTENVNVKGKKAQINGKTETLPPEKESTTGTNSSSPDENEDDILDKFENTDNANAIDDVDDKLEADADKKVNAEASSTSAKRLLSDSNIKSDSKMLRLNKRSEKQTSSDVDSDEGGSGNDEDSLPPLPEPVKTLHSMDDYLNLLSLRHLSYNDLEMVFVQTTHNVNGYKRELRQMKQALAMREQMVERYIEETMQLSKHTRDLEIEVKRIFQELQLTNGTDESK